MVEATSLYQVKHAPFPAYGVQAKAVPPASGATPSEPSATTGRAVAEPTAETPVTPSPALKAMVR